MREKTDEEILYERNMAINEANFMQGGKDGLYFNIYIRPEIGYAYYISVYNWYLRGIKTHRRCLPNNS